jgi:hypothetical protein
VVLGDVSFVCPVTGKKCSVGATVRLKPVPIMQMPLLDDDQADAVQGALVEADRDG